MFVFSKLPQKLFNASVINLLKRLFYMGTVCLTPYPRHITLFYIFITLQYCLDQRRWSYTFQTCALLTRHEIIQSAIDSVAVNRKSGKPWFMDSYEWILWYVVIFCLSTGLNICIHMNMISCISVHFLDTFVGRHIFLTERCLDTDCEVFTKMLRDDGSIDSLEYSLYNMLLKQVQSTATPLSAIIFLDTKPAGIHIYILPNLFCVCVLFCFH